MEEEIDFLGNTFIESKCPRCKGSYRRMSIDSRVRLCADCDNEEDGNGPIHK